MNFRHKHELNGKKISIHDIIKYIEDNSKFINKKSILLEDNLSDESTDNEKDNNIEDILYYGDKKELSNLPSNLNAIFSNISFNRVGVLQNVNIPAKKNISYVSSLLTLLVPHFIDLDKREQISYIQNFIRFCNKNARTNYNNFGYSDLGWKMRDFTSNIRNFNFGKDLLKYICDILYINLFIVDIEEDSLVYVGDYFFNKYKKNLFVLKLKEDNFEPLMTNKYYQTYKSSIIKKLINSTFLVERLDVNFNNKHEDFEFKIGLENINNYDIDCDTINKDDNSDDNSDNMNCFEEDDNYKTNYDIADGVTDKVVDSETDTDDDSENEETIKVDETYKVVKLKKIAKELGIKLTYKKNNKSVSKTKKILIKDINEFSQ
jgi:hypothetical protein